MYKIGQLAKTIVETKKKRVKNTKTNPKKKSQALKSTLDKYIQHKCRPKINPSSMKTHSPPTITETNDPTRRDC